MQCSLTGRASAALSKGSMCLHFKFAQNCLRANLAQARVPACTCMLSKIPCCVAIAIMSVLGIRDKPWAQPAPIVCACQIASWHDQLT